MPSRSTYIARSHRTWAVYWGNPRSAGTGNRTYDAPRDVRVRRDAVQKIFKNGAGEQTLSTSVIYCVEPLDLGGYIMVGRTRDLASDRTLPEKNRDAEEIGALMSSQSVDGRVTLRAFYMSRG